MARLTAAVQPGDLVSILGRSARVLDLAPYRHPWADDRPELVGRVARLDTGRGVTLLDSDLFTVRRWL